jgi:hypothetical protein
VSAYLRRCTSRNIAAVLRRRGDAAAGAIFVSVDHGDGRATLYSPSSVADSLDPSIERFWRRAHREDTVSVAELNERIRREINFDPDLWWVEVDDPRNRHGLDLDPA